MRVRIPTIHPHQPHRYYMLPYPCPRKRPSESVPCPFHAAHIYSLHNGVICPLRGCWLSLCIPPHTPAMAIVSRTLDSLRSYLGSLTWGPFVNISRSTVLALLTRIEIGQLVLRDSDGAVTVCGQPGIKDPSPRTDLRVLKEAFWVRVVLFADMVGDPILPLGAVGRLGCATCARAEIRID